MTKIYLDTNILVAYVSDAESNREQKAQVASAFQTFSELKDVELLTSVWAITELVKALIVNIKMDPTRVSEIEKDLVNEGRIHALKIRILDVSPRHDYDFTEFFYHVRKGIITNSSGVGDNIHAVIMKNNGVEKVLTFNTKDFVTILGITAMHPKDIKI